MRVVLDTNVVISGLLFGGPPARLLRVLSRPPFELWSSGELLAELSDTLVERKFAHAVAGSGFTLDSLYGSYARRALAVPEASLASVEFPADPKDAKVIAAVVAADAHWLITGDRHLLTAHLDLPCEVLTVAEALPRAEALLHRDSR